MPTEKKLKLSSIEEQLAKLGLTQSSVSEQIGKTRQAVSKWFKGESFPRPPELLKLGKVLELSYKDLVEIVEPDPHEPIVAFRKRGSSKTTEKHFERAKVMGQRLASLVPHLSVDQFFGASVLKSPSLDYGYIQALVKKVRLEMELGGSDCIKGSHLRDYFIKQQAILIPVMWGKKEKHENALHIYLPESKSTWIYLNLDAYIPDFKFWMAHELGHVLSLDLIEDQNMDFAEDFADTFAGALVFPESQAKIYYEEYAAQKNETYRMKVVVKASESLMISPFSIHKELDKFAAYHELPFVTLEDKAIAFQASRLNKKFGTVSEKLFGTEPPNADEYIRRAQAAYDTEFFTALEKLLQEEHVGEKYITNILDLGLLDGKAIYQALQK